MRSGLARLFRYRNKGRMRFGRKLVRLEMVRAQSEQEDDRDRDADQVEQNGPHEDFSRRLTVNCVNAALAEDVPVIAPAPAGR